jgi:alpha-galactosidase
MSIFLNKNRRCPLQLVRSIFFLSIVLLLTNYSISKEETIQFIKKGGELQFKNKNIQLTISNSTKLKVGYIKDKKETSLNIFKDESTVIPHFLIIDKEKVNDFKIDPKAIQLQSVETEFGQGKELIIKANAFNQKIEKELRIALYEKYPDAAIIKTSYKNLQLNKPVIIDKIYSNAFLLDRKKVNTGKESCDFWGFLGYGKIIGGRHDNVRVNVLPIEEDLNVLNDSEIISGIPMVDIWAPEMGLAIASIEPKVRILKMPVRVDSSKQVNIALVEEPDKKLNPGESFSALQTAIIVHALDFFAPVKRWSDIMKDQGMTFKTCPEFGYKPFWCNWGYKRDWKLSHGLDRLDEFKQLGIKAVTIDDGWFEYYGDWFVSPERFPKGDKQLKEWIDQFHAEGLKTVFWWVPGVGGPVTVKDHPDWFIKNENGDMTQIHWKDSHMLCPALPEVIQYHKDLARKFIVEYGFDGFKLDGIYVAPRCYNSVHNHQTPDESYTAYEDLFKAIYETVMEIRPDGDFILGMCPCGALCSPYYLQWGNRPVTADPPQITISTRHRVKVYKALLGPTSCVDNDFHERYNDYFPVEFGCGGLMTNKYTKLSDYEFAEFKKWYGFYNQYQISSGEYLNLYDVAYDVPETYVIKKENVYFYTFLKPGITGPEKVPWFENLIDQRTEMLKAFDKELDNLPVWEGKVELRGLENKKYMIYNLETDEKLDEVEGPSGSLNISFKDHLIIRAVPVK